MEVSSKDFLPNGRIVNRTIISKGNPGMLFVKAEWCGHCQRFKPVYSELSRRYSRHFTFVHIDESSMSDSLKSGMNVRGYPTVLFFNRFGQIMEMYDGGRDLDSMTKAIDRFYHKQ